ncbi:hypothetical protein NE237_011401 [Protea cynaroides]|uniref:glutaredoxin-dependent peroxiredoxin n=1 Tax=Protea cynaroides TaxID=273540 RepID=A0A9Q0JY89_9MAGN|nr:hypothetical protein NE237_011401 [Protea cynaroides]
MESAIFRRCNCTSMQWMATGVQAVVSRALASVSVGADIVNAAPSVSLQKAQTWDEGVSSNFSTTSFKEIFKGKKVVLFGLPGAFTGVCTKADVPSYKKTTSISSRPKGLTP